jgi:hypothetical protein
VKVSVKELSYQYRRLYPEHGDLYLQSLYSHSRTMHRGEIFHRSNDFGVASLIYFSWSKGESRSPVSFLSRRPLG